VNRAAQRLLVALCLICGVIFLLRNHDARALHPAADLAPPVWQEGLLQSEHLRSLDGARFLCRRDRCDENAPWPTSNDPSSWLEGLGQKGVGAGLGQRPDAPALIRSENGWIILWGERSDRLEVVVQGRGAGVWPRRRLGGLYELPWWGPLR